MYERFAANIVEIPPGFESKTPCHHCNHCCRSGGGEVYLQDVDDASIYQVVEDENGDKRLARAANGDCIYLDRKTGCSIHGARPRTCRTFDCAALVRRNDRKTLEKVVEMGITSAAIVERGRQLLKQGYRPVLPELRKPRAQK
jgi:hypothetical protein